MQCEERQAQFVPKHLGVHQNDSPQTAATFTRLRVEEMVIVASVSCRLSNCCMLHEPLEMNRNGSTARLRC